MSKKPLYQARMGTVSGAAWANETKNGTLFSVTFSRSYKEGGTWKDTGSFHREHLPLLMKVADTLHTYLYEKPAESEEEPSGSGKE